MKYRILNEGVENNFLDGGVEYRYDSYSCDDESCGCRDGNDYCRSASYKGLEVESANLDSVREHFLVTSAKKKDVVDISNIDFVDYCVDRLLRIYQVYDKDVWDISTSHGYYGDEIDEICLNNFGSLRDDIIKVIKLSSNKRIEFVLEKEYGNLLASVGQRKWSVKKIDSSLLLVGNKEYVKKIPITQRGVYQKHNLPIGIYIKIGQKYQLVDGYHRYVEIVQAQKENPVEIICGIY